ncbi:3-deoxy-manno-octulosonate cytidylyltransferase [Wenyingzhuangia sp. 2_MG-2023]|uniref:3-deoxy-manno-octulosonate cytidylyltransferase n=1 Tax=Wenyingzhuangia sp. 2_MG-2023 TaxID=3062639 RepID=UPI0026E2E5F3|nr:3-deoxy-manno-octulosonate cytidylyltransferase [Wenyingzhuangia sp. 2_MG-2023]MDO6738599.1 3-deoxy-manno-octulosonate cytidylyltransferase [Wenyingzhuangia sp. 2_MG-2023]MDO6802869.1 3-deoxy-manno-octulosonate cytidylyltransferase [Wenyingzhuangia sp. 1_MG-2023]
MKVIAMIPARLQASRFPKKLLRDLCGKTVITRTYEATVNTGLFDEVYVVTDSDKIQAEIEANGGKVIRSIKEHECGSDRISEAANSVAGDIIINVQGDEPFTRKEPLQDLIQVFKDDLQGDIAVASLVHTMDDWEEIVNPNNVKVVLDAKNCAMYFSRAPIPHPRDTNVEVKFYKHIGIYAFRRFALLNFPEMEMLQNEATEKLEGIRFLEHGMKMKMVETPFKAIGIDTPEDLQKAIHIIQDGQL